MLIFIYHLPLEFILRAKTNYKLIALNYWASSWPFTLPATVSSCHALLWNNKEQPSVSMSTVNWGSRD